MDRQTWLFEFCSAWWQKLMIKPLMNSHDWAIGELWECTYYVFLWPTALQIPGCDSGILSFQDGKTPSFCKVPQQNQPSNSKSIRFLFVTIGIFNLIMAAPWLQPQKQVNGETRPIAWKKHQRIGECITIRKIDKQIPIYSMNIYFSIIFWGGTIVSTCPFVVWSIYG